MSKEVKIERYTVRLVGCVEPELYGPYDTDADRVVNARDLLEVEDAILRLNIVNGVPEVESFANFEMEDEE